MKWFRKSDFNLKGIESVETWIREDNSIEKHFPIELKLGKKTDLLSFKQNVIESIEQKNSEVRESRINLYNKELETVSKCPICESDSKNTKPFVRVYGANYVICKNCNHAYVINRPTQKSIIEYYKKSESYSQTYTDIKTYEARLDKVAFPFVDYTVNVFEKTFGRKPKRILDVGAGAGHFVEACKRRGIDAYGIEPSESSRKFAKDIWNIEMDGRDFTKVYTEYSNFDVITFWGVLEHVTNPNEFVKAAHQILSSNKGGMVISKFPLWDSLGGKIQSIYPEKIIRHLDPLGHITMFSTASAAELYFRNGLIPTNGWYYGMDVYELLLQLGNYTGSYKHFLETGDIQIELQQFIDEAKVSDGIVLAAKIINQ